MVAIWCAAACNGVFGADIELRTHLDKPRYLAGAPAFLIFEYTNRGPVAVRFDEEDLYCMEPNIETTLHRSIPPVCPDRGVTIIECMGLRTELRPGQTYTFRYLLNGRFDLNQPGTYQLTVFGRDGKSPSKETHALVLEPASDQAVRLAYQPYFAQLDSADDKTRNEAVRVVSGAGAAFVEPSLLLISIDPRNGSYQAWIASEGLARLRTPLACARLAELGLRPDSEHQQQALQYMGQCGTGYVPLLFNLVQRPDQYPATRQFELLAAGEAGAEAAVDRLLHMTFTQESYRESVFLALGRTGSRRAAKAIIDMLPSLAPENIQFAALSALATLTHRQSAQKDFAAKAKEWQQWWVEQDRLTVYDPRDCQGGVVAIVPRAP
jgi:hypothetical protein